MNKFLNKGDWVYSYSKGVYRVEQVIDRFYEECSILGTNKIGDNYEDRIVVTKRLLNSKFKKSIGYESCSELFVNPLNQEDKQQLKEVISQNPTLLTDLDCYQIPQIVSIYNQALQIDDPKDISKINQLVTYIRTGKTYVEIIDEMRRLDVLKLKQKNFGNYCFQLFNYNYEYFRKRQIWRDAKLSEAF